MKIGIQKPDLSSQNDLNKPFQKIFLMLLKAAVATHLSHNKNPCPLCTNILRMCMSEGESNLMIFQVHVVRP